MYRVVHDRSRHRGGTIISKEYFIISGNSITIVMVVVQSVLQSTSLSSEMNRISCGNVIRSGEKKSFPTIVLRDARLYRT